MTLILLLLLMDYCPTVWLSGSGGNGEPPFHDRAISGKTRLCASGAAAVCWSWCWAAILLSSPVFLFQPLNIDVSAVSANPYTIY